MSLAKNVLILLILLVIVWASFLLVAYVMAFTIFPALEQGEGNVAMSVARVIIGATVFSAWIYGWYALTRFWFYRVLLKE